jgi:hypothetical protein
MTNRVCTHATCISRVQASVLAICRFVGSGDDQNPQVQTVKLEIQNLPENFIRARTDSSKLDFVQQNYS